MLRLRLLGVLLVLALVTTACASTAVAPTSAPTTAPKPDVKPTDAAKPVAASPAAGASPAAKPAASPAASPAGSPAAGAPSGKRLRIGLVTDVGKVDDKSFNQSAWEGVQRAQRELGAETKFIETTDPKDYGKNIDQFALEGYRADSEGVEQPVRIFFYRGTIRINGSIEFAKAAGTTLPAQITALADPTKTQGAQLMEVQIVTDGVTA